MTTESNPNEDFCPHCGAPRKTPFERAIVGSEGLKYVDVPLDQVIAVIKEIIRLKNMPSLNTAIFGTNVIQLISGWSVKKEGNPLEKAPGNPTVL